MQVPTRCFIQALQAVLKIGMALVLDILPAGNLTPFEVEERENTTAGGRHGPIVGNRLAQ